MTYKPKIVILIHKFRNHPKWTNFYLKTIKNNITQFNLPMDEIIECTQDQLCVNEDFCLPLIIESNDTYFPSIKKTFHSTTQNQIIAIFHSENSYITINYLNQDNLTVLETFRLL